MTRRRTTVTVDGRSFILSRAADLEVFEQEVTDALRAGGGFVGVPLGGDRVIRVLVTTAIPILIESVTIVDDVVDESTKALTAYTFDEFDLGSAPSEPHWSEKNYARPSSLDDARAAAARRSIRR